MSVKKALFIAYEFPPEGARGTKRIVKFVRYIRAHNWQPVILTVSNPNYDFHDGSLLHELPPDLAVHKAFTLEGFFQRVDLTADEVRDVLTEKTDLVQRSLRKRFVIAIYHFFGKIFFFGDSRILWAPFAILKGWRLIRDENVALIFASGPSFTNHIVGMVLKKLTKKPLVIDFRDAWASDPAIVWRNKRKKKFTEKMEKRAIDSADKVVSTTEGITSDFHKRYGEVRGKFITIHNGYDPNDFQDYENDLGFCRKLPFTIMHVGTLGDERSPKEFLNALGDLIKHNPEMRDKIQLVFVGQTYRFRDGNTIDDYIQQYDLRGVVKLQGYVARLESIRFLRSAHLLLLIIGRVPEHGRDIYGVSGKIYDYAFSGKPVMTLAEAGASASMAMRLNLGCVVHPDDSDSVKKWIRIYYDAFLEGTLRANVNMDYLAKYDFSNLSAALARCFDGALSQSCCESSRETERV